MGHPAMQDSVGTNTMGHPLLPFFMPRKFPFGSNKCTLYTVHYVTYG